MDAKESPYVRLLRPAVERALQDTPVVCLLGPRQCGKSTLARTFTPSFTYISLDEDAYLATARSDPAGFVAALPHPVILDEVQHVPELFRAIKVAVDRERRPGRFLLTGSANLLLLPQLGDSLAGRMEVLYLQPLAEPEKERRPGAFLRTFLEGGFKAAITAADEDAFALADRVVAGGYPEPISRAPDRARRWHREYVRTLMERDVSDIARVADVRELERLLELLALRNAELLNVSGVGGDLGLDRETVARYLAILERLFLVRRLPAWHRNEAKRLIKTPKIHLVDSGLAATLAGLTASDWLARRERFGHLLESFVIQQVVAQAGWTDPEVRLWHYRDKDQVEVDLVLTKGKRTWGIEIKASSSIKPSDGHGLRLLAECCGKDFQHGIVLHSGASVLPLSDPRLLAVPLRRLWEL